MDDVPIQISICPTEVDRPLSHAHVLPVQERIKGSKDWEARHDRNRIAATLRRYGRSVKTKKEAEHTLVVSVEPLIEWRVVVRRTGRIEAEPTNRSAKDRPIPNLPAHIGDALERQFTVTTDCDTGGFVMEPTISPQTYGA